MKSAWRHRVSSGNQFCYCDSTSTTDDDVGVAAVQAEIGTIPPMLPPTLFEGPSPEGGRYRDNRSTRNASERRALRPSRTTASPATRTVSTVRLLAQVSSVAPGSRTGRHA